MYVYMSKCELLYEKCISSKLLAMREEILMYKLQLIVLLSFWLALNFVYILKWATKGIVLLQSHVYF